MGEQTQGPTFAFVGCSCRSRVDSRQRQTQLSRVSGGARRLGETIVLAAGQIKDQRPHFHTICTRIERFSDGRARRRRGLCRLYTSSRKRIPAGEAENEPSHGCHATSPQDDAFNSVPVLSERSVHRLSSSSLHAGKTIDNRFLGACLKCCLSTNILFAIRADFDGEHLAFGVTSKTNVHCERYGRYAGFRYSASLRTCLAGDVQV